MCRPKGRPYVVYLITGHYAFKGEARGGPGAGIALNANPGTVTAGRLVEVFNRFWGQSTNEPSGRMTKSWVSGFNALQPPSSTETMTLTSSPLVMSHIASISSW